MLRLDVIETGDAAHQIAPKGHAMTAPPADARAGDRLLWVPLILRLQHGLLVLSVLFLCLTGFALHFHENAVAQWIIALEGGFAARGLIHRVAAIAMVAVVLWHFVYVVFTDEGHSHLMRLLPRRKDWRDFLSQLRSNLSSGKGAPALDRYSFHEKFQYWAVAALTIAMILTGILLWFGSETMALFPKFIIDLIRILHGYEATFAFVALFLWHIYNVHASPGRVTDHATAFDGYVDAEKVRRLRPGEIDRMNGGRGTA